jgi:hypothetical protein
MWILINRLLCMLQPLEELQGSHSRACKSISLNYNSLPPQLTILKAARAGHLACNCTCRPSLPGYPTCKQTRIVLTTIRSQVCKHQRFRRTTRRSVAKRGMGRILWRVPRQHWRSAFLSLRVQLHAEHVSTRVDRLGRHVSPFSSL